MLFVYELFNLWADPWATGLMIVGYFIAAFAVDFLFKRASFCKYVCPVGQFNFLASTLSPLEVAMRDPNARTTCRTKAVGGAVSLGQTINRFTRSLVPFGFGVWLAHYGFHFFTGALTVIPVSQYAVSRATGHAWLGAPQWQLGGLPVAMVYPLELGFLSLGMVASLLIAWRISGDFAPKNRIRACWPWAFVIVLLFATACWTMSQPMDMRGTFVS